jgi:hypothetical protein
MKEGFLSSNMNYHEHPNFASYIDMIGQHVT